MSETLSEEFEAHAKAYVPFARMGIGNGLLIFLHGLGQCSAHTWHLEDETESIPSQICKDSTYDSYTVLCIDWPASRSGRRWSLKSATEAVVSILRKVFHNLDWVTVLVIVGHSYGGLIAADIAKTILTGQSRAPLYFNSSVKVMLQLIACPLTGSPYARFSRSLSRADYLRSLDGSDDYVNDMLDRIRSRINTDRLFGREYVETEFYKSVRIAGIEIPLGSFIRNSMPLVVDQHSANALFPEPIVVQESDHSSITLWSKIGEGIGFDFSKVAELSDKRREDPYAAESWADTFAENEYNLRRIEFDAARRRIQTTIGQRTRKTQFIFALDLDRCSQMNRRIGPLKTSRILDRLAIFFSGITGETVERVGPDEFVCVFACRTQNRAALKMSHLLSRISNTSSNLLGYHMTVACGYCEIKNREQPLNDVWRAYEGCRQSKANGSVASLGPDEMPYHETITWERFDKYDPKTLDQRRHVERFANEPSENEAFNGFFL